MKFVVDEGLDPVALGKASSHSGSVLPDSLPQFRSHTGIQRSVRVTGEYVDGWLHSDRGIKGTLIAAVRWSAER